jgi:cyclophilin family peptidyl-prolyl cis-trans isomerase
VGYYFPNLLDLGGVVNFVKRGDNFCMKEYSTTITVLLLVAVAVVAGWFYITAKDNKNDMDNADGVAGVRSAVLKTNMGDIEIEFFGKEAPTTVENFVTLAKNGFFDGTKFHRVIKDFMIQGGDPLSKGDDKSMYGRGGPGYQFADEQVNIKLEKGIVAMANSGPNTNGSQFFIITADATPWLDGKHTPFARVISGMDIVEKIENTPVSENDIPVTAVVVTAVELK